MLRNKAIDKFTWPLFETTPRKEEADYYCTVLQHNNIDFLLDDLQSNFNAITGQSVVDTHYIIRIQQKDFFTANESIHQQLMDDVQLDDDYYLQQFSDNSLIELLIEKEKWSRYDVAAAATVLEQRGVEYKKEVDFKRKSGAAPYHSKHIEHWALMLSYLMLAILPIYSLVAGFLYRNAKDTDRNGYTHFAYDEPTRKHGANLMIFGILILAGSMIVLLKKYS